MKPETTSPTLLSRVRDPADSRAWKEFDERYGDLIVRYSCRSGLQHPDAEDIRQIVMLKVSKALRAFRYRPERGRFRSWLGRIVQNEIVRHRSRPNRESALVEGMDDESQTSGGREPPEEWEREWHDHHLRLAMRRIRQSFEPRSVEVFQRLLAGDSVEHVAAFFEMGTQAVHKVKQRIRDRLREAVAEQIRGEEE